VTAVLRRLRLVVVLVAALVPAPLWAQKAVYVARHAEKQSEGSAPEVPLSEAGKARAARLAAMLRDAGITAIYATDTVRARGTASPLSEAVGRPVQTYSNVDALAESLRREPEAVVLVVGHSNTVPALIAALGVEQKIVLGDGDYDNLFVVVPRASGSPVLLRLKY
jgi:broad specificity phosphatase PhoE